METGGRFDPVQADLLRDLIERADEIEGVRLRLPEGPSVWLHTTEQVEAWLGGLADEAEQADRR